MAEGWTRHLKGDVIEAHSAGVQPQGLNPWAVRVMAEAGVDISGHRSKHLNEVLDISFDYVITVCDDAAENCPVFPGSTTRLHVAFPDPPRLAQGLTDEEAILEIYRDVRDAIRRFVETLPESLPPRQTCVG
jgi:arsenate reductase